METELARRIMDLGCTQATEEQLGLHHFRLTVDDEHVDAVRRSVYEHVSMAFKVDVIGASELTAADLELFSINLASSEYLDRWSDINVPTEEVTRDTSVRDAVQKNW